MENETEDWDVVDQASLESFPASDPPGWGSWRAAPSAASIAETQESHTKPSPIGEGAELDLVAAGRELTADSAYEHDGHTARTLVREPRLRIVLIAMKSGARIAEHRSQDSVSVQVIAGRVQLALPTHGVDLQAGRLLAIAPAVPHALEATVDSTILLTLAWNRD